MSKVTIPEADEDLAFLPRPSEAQATSVGGFPAQQAGSSRNQLGRPFPSKILAACVIIADDADTRKKWHRHFPDLHSAPAAVCEASRKKQIPSSPSNLMGVFLTSSSLAFAVLAGSAEETALYQIRADGDYHSPGRPAAASILLAIGGKPQRLEWLGETTTQPVTITVDRITDTRRTQAASGAAKAGEKGWAWDWTPPVTRSVVRYEIQLGEKADSRVKFEVRDPQWVRGLMSHLPEMKWEAAGLTSDEMAALSKFGLHRITLGTKASEPYLRLISDGPNHPRRQVTWDTEHLDLVVWRPGIAAGDLEIRAPRWWISPRSLASDEGLIRFLDLYCDAPVSP